MSRTRPTHPDVTAVRAAARRREAADRSEEVWSELGGYRLLRTLGSGEHSTAHLARGDDGAVVVKTFPAGSSDEMVATVECLASVASPHVVRIVDVSVVERRPACVVLERLEGELAADWLRLRQDIEAGEAVTVCVAALRAVQAVHAAGWTHGAPNAAHFRFDGAGCPVLIGFTDARRATPSRVGSDWQSVAALAARLLRAVPPGDVEQDRADLVERKFAALCASVEAGAAPGSESTALAAVEDALFSLAPVAPVGPVPTRGDALPVADRDPAIVHDDSVRDTGDMADASRAPARHRRGAVHALGSAFVSAMENGVSSRIAAHVRRFTRAHRRPILVAAAAVIGMTCVTLVVLPGHGSGSAESAPVSSRPAPDPTNTTADATKDPVAAASAPASAAASPAQQDEDAVRAAFRLLAARARCLSRTDAACLTSVDQPDSPIAAADAVLVAGGGDASAVPEMSRLSLVEALGDAAVIAVAPDGGTTKPASLLLVRTEAGWRLRALFEN